MTTYIKKVTMLPITTPEQHYDAFEYELELVDDMLDALKDIIKTMDEKDNECVVGEELEELDQFRMDLRDSMVNINKIVKSYIKTIGENRNE